MSIIRLRQLIRFSVVGVLNNLMGYIIYLLVAWLWFESKFAVTLIYTLEQ